MYSKTYTTCMTLQGQNKINTKEIQEKNTFKKKQKKRYQFYLQHPNNNDCVIYDERMIYDSKSITSEVCELRYIYLPTAENSHLYI